MLAMIATLATLTRPQTQALVEALIGYFQGSLAFKVDFGKSRPEIEDMIASWSAISEGKRSWTKWEAELVTLLPRMPYTVPEQARARGVYLRALHKAGLISGATLADLEANRANCFETDARVKGILNPAPAPGPCSECWDGLGPGPCEACGRGGKAKEPAPVQVPSEIEVSIRLCDHLNPGFGYSIRVTRRGGTLLFTDKHPVTGEDLTYETALDIARTYAGSL